MDKEIIDAVRRKAVGYSTTERTEELQMDDNGQMQTVKVRLVTKEVPPDITAVKCLMDMDNGSDIEKMTAEQLAAEKMRLLLLLKENQNETNKK